MSYLQSLAEERRGTILYLLLKTELSASETVLLHGLRQAGHLRITEDLVRADLEWLRNANLVTTDVFEGTRVIAKLTRRGRDVAQGNLAEPGVERPDPLDAI